MRENDEFSIPAATSRGAGSPRPLALVTGASSGLGQAYARRLAHDGYDVILVARDRGRLLRLARELKFDHGVDTEVFDADLTDAKQLRRVEERITRDVHGHIGGLDFLVNAAGFFTVGDFADCDIDAQEEMIRLHVLATVRLTRAALPGMLAKASLLEIGGCAGCGAAGTCPFARQSARPAPAIVNISSLAALFPAPGNVSYHATKLYIKSFTETLALETAGSALRLIVVCPGWTRTEIHARNNGDPDSVPRGWWMTAEYVVDETMKDLEIQKLCCIPGFRYKCVALLSQLLPTGLRRRLTLRYYEKKKRRREV